MHVCFLKSRVDISLGGANESLHLVAEELAKEGYDISLLTLLPEENQLPSERAYRHIDLDVPVPTPGERIDRVLPDVLAQNDTDIDVFHGFGPNYGPSLAKYGKNNDSGTVLRLNSYGLFCFNMSQMDGTCHQNCGVTPRFRHYDGPLWKATALLPVMSYAGRRLDQLNNIDHICAQSPPVKDIYGGAGVGDPPMTVIPNMFNDAFSTEPLSVADFDPHSFHLLFTGRLVPEKGLDVLVEAAQRLDDEYMIHIVGDGPLLADLRQDAPENVRFHGYIDHYNLGMYYHAADVFVHPVTYPDPCPRGVLEAMSAGLPLIVSDLGAPAWMAGDGCLAFPSGDAVALKEQIEQLRHDSELREMLSQSTEAELKKFERDRIIGKYIDVYESVESTI